LPFLFLTAKRRKISEKYRFRIKQWIITTENSKPGDMDG